MFLAVPSGAMSLSGHGRRLGVLKGVFARQQRLCLSTALERAAENEASTSVARVPALSEFKTKALDPLDTFEARHMGPSEAEQAEMLATLGFSSLDELVTSTVPASIRLAEPMELGSHQSEAMGETEALALLKTMASKNKVLKSFIGMGYHDCKTPAVILRNVLENPGWYTQYVEIAGWHRSSAIGPRRGWHRSSARLA